MPTNESSLKRPKNFPTSINRRTWYPAGRPLSTLAVLYVRMAAAPYRPYARATYALPRPGPTFRARVGDLVQLTFINQINPADFGDSIDRGETGRGGGCDESSGGYPGSDKFPDCFHGSSTGNIHFHGTHTNPNTTADNVFIEVRPSLRKDGKPIVTPESVAPSFDKFFAKCEVELSRSQLREWPRTW